MSVLHLAEYRALVDLDQPFEWRVRAAAEDVPHLLNVVARHLVADGTGARFGVSLADVPSTDDAVGLRRLVRRLLTVRGPEPLPHDMHAALEAVLEAERVERGETQAGTLPRVAEAVPGARYAAAGATALWRGDITTLAADAIVNAANAELLGCFRPFHACIDNAIHSAAGPRLREDCGRIMARQEQPEPTGTAKMTRGYHLPARFVLHTVGPIVQGELRPAHEAQLASCYRACLDLAAARPGVRTVAFCAISTGVFGFPKAPAAQIATRTVAEWLAAHPDALDLVVFNVFGEEDRLMYEDVFAGRA